MRKATIFLAAVVAIGVTGSAPAEDQTADPALSEDATPCGCGGPKAIYAAKYGTVQPPALQQSNPIVRPEAEQPAATEEPETDTNAGG
ncbi:MAG: hypothetical protein SGJ07_17785 [Rhodospirillaceae bacterium]|nr:hypothetical protein [Rhodospirillaceae bacterium]